MRVLARWLAVAGLGVVALLAGLAWDVLRHGDDPGLAHRESLFTLGNPGHVLFLAGVAAVVVGVAGAGLSMWRPAPAVRALVAVGGAVALVGSAGVVAWAAGTGGGRDPAGAAAAGLTSGQADGHDAGTSDAGGPSTTAVPGGAHAAPAAGSHGSGACAPTAAQQAAADRLYADTEAGLARFRDLADATAAGYRRITPPEWPTVHYLNDAYAADGALVDPARPEALIYANTRKGTVLAAAMYLTNRIGEPGPELGGCLTTWHTHTDLCFSVQTAEVVGFTSPAGGCPAGSVNFVTPEMMHVWVVDVPEGRFAPDVDEAALVRRLGR